MIFLRLCAIVVADWPFPGGMKTLIIATGLLCSLLWRGESAPLIRAGGLGRSGSFRPMVTRVPSLLTERVRQSFGSPARPGIPTLNAPRSDPRFAAFRRREQFRERGRPERFFSRGRRFFVSPLFLALCWPNCFFPPDWLPDDSAYSIDNSPGGDSAAYQVPNEDQSESQLYATFLTDLAQRVATLRATAEASNAAQPATRSMAGAYFSPSQNAAPAAFESQPQPTKFSNASSAPPAKPADEGIAAQQNHGVLPKRILLSWLRDGGKDVVVVQDTQSKEVQRITTEPNRSNFRIIKVRPDIDPQLSEVVISDGTEQETVKFP